ncbi:MAG: TonB-dependent receptor [Bacteroidales bacterium]|nr:TonB-dependent receptor [Bacteroidales bacterium]
MGKGVVIFIFFLAGALDSHSQAITQVIKGIVIDNDTRIALPGANIIELNSSPPNGAVTDSFGKFRITTGIGRITIKVTFLGYEEMIIRDILVASGKEVDLEIALTEKVVQTSDVIIRSDKSGRKNINQMATISTNTIRTDDALRYAGGFYDPSRIVNAFAGVVTANSDQSNDIVIRGNSSRGLLWRVEGIEIPNPNHFSDGQGGSGGAFSAITSNIISNFDFFTGAFPAEFGNAFSGVMDLNLRKGNADKHEFAFQTGMIGAEVSMEGPFSARSGASFLLNARYTNFKILSDLELIDLGETNFAPRTKDLGFNINIPAKKAGTLNIFGIYGASSLGRIPSHNISEWQTLSDRWEEMEEQGSGTTGLKHLYAFKNSKTYIKTVLAYSSFTSRYREGYIDSLLVTSNSYTYSYLYPSLRSSILVNHKFNPENTVRAGINLNFLSAEMKNFKLNTTGQYDTLVAPSASGDLIQGYVQWKYRPAPDLELNSGVHILESSLNKQVSIEPRFGLRWQVTPQGSFMAGFGMHSRIESLAVYNALIKDNTGARSALNSEMDFSKALHWVAGFDISVTKDIRLRVEGYIQYLYNIPIVNKITSQYSTINSSERLPEALLENEGTGMNNGVELTVEKAFTRNYYFLFTGSLFDSWYQAGDKRRYSTYYNTKYVSNLLAGKDFYVGKNKRNSIGINAKYVFRGGYRFTPVDEKKSLKSKRIIYDNTSYYEGQLPDFWRLDAGINFRRNHNHYSWIIMLDIQNAANHKNVFRRRFNWENGGIVSSDVLSLGIIPVFNFRVEF